MTLPFPLPPIHSRIRLAILVIGLFVVTVAFAWYGYFPWTSATALAVLSCLPLLSAGPAPRRSWRWLPLVGLCIGVCIWLPFCTVLYFCTVAVGMLLCEAVGKRPATLAGLALMVVSPVSDYVLGVLSLPLRLGLTSGVASALRGAGWDVVAEGNAVRIGSELYAVDAACAGLNMLQTGWLAGLILLALYVKRGGRLSAIAIGGSLLGMTLLLLLANGMRILTLVVLRLPAETVGHELAGVLSFLVYALLPGVLVWRWFLSRMGQTAAESTTGKVRSRMVPMALVTTMLAACTVWVEVREDDRKSTALPITAVPGFAVKAFNHEVLQLSAADGLIYVKKPQGFYSTDHSPMICWRGSGYELRNVSTQSTAGFTIHTAMLHKGNATLYTAWWFDNGEEQTHSAWRWRRRMIEGAPAYSLVNVTTTSAGSLQKLLLQLQSEKLLTPVLRSLH